MRSCGTPGASVSLVRFGVMRHARRVAGQALGAAELAIAAALWTWPTAAPVLLAASALFAVFVALISRALAKGRHFDCGCFGGHDHLGPRTLLRAGALAVLAATAAATVLLGSVDAPSIGERAAALATGVLVLLQVVVISDLRSLRPFDPRLRGVG